MDISSVSKKVFENEDRLFFSGNRDFMLNIPDENQNGTLSLPFGISSFDDREICAVELTKDLVDDIVKFEQEIWQQIKPLDWAKTTKSFHSNIKTNNEVPSMNLKITPETEFLYYDHKKGTFSKIKKQEIPKQAQAAIACKARHPWKFEIKNVAKCGVSFEATQIIVYWTPKNKKTKRITLKDVITGQQKKKTKLMEHKEL